uniref:Retrovirus-related Pol polyprotein from transposon TNT 1-94-like beta-barrel domain-containing protein n=1 Tax=Peronospora matthiolae TaxID=2874970 RepID=A0AAV1UBA3_9STRA
MHEDMKRKEQGGGGDVSAHGQGQAFMTSNHSKRKGGRPVQKASACHYCGEQGHWIAKCLVKIRENAERQRSQRASVAQVKEDSGEFLFSADGDNIKLSEEWLVDLCATQHTTYSKEYMKNYQKISPVDVQLADDGVVQAVGKGDIIMSMRTKHGVKKGVLTGVWHIPKLTRNLFFVGRLTKNIDPVTFESDGCFAQSKSVKWQLGTRKGKGLLKLCMTPLMPDEANVSSSTGLMGPTGRTSGIFDLAILAITV